MKTLSLSIYTSSKWPAIANNWVGGCGEEEKAMRANPIDKKLRDFAREHDLYVFQTMLTGQYRAKKDGGTAITGPCSKRHAKELRDFIWNWHKRVTKANEKLLNAHQEREGLGR